MQLDRPKRRQFIRLLGGAAAWPLAARAQQPQMPVIGFLKRDFSSPDRELYFPATRRGMAEMGLVEGRDFTIEYRSAEGHTDRLSTLAADLVSRRVAVIVAPGNTPSALAAKQATQTIPIVFLVGADPVESGLVESLNRPGGNATGVSLIDVEVIAKRIQLLHQLSPGASSIALLVNPNNRIVAEAETREAQAAAHALGLDLLVLQASKAEEIPVSIAALLRRQPSVLLVSMESFFFTVQDQLIDLATRNKIAMSISVREAVRKGALFSYGPDLIDAFRQVGIYAGRLLRGESPADLPVQRSIRFSLVINLKTAKAIGLTVPEQMLVAADEVIE
jgi:putative tryptophan/tyrosine transport system substrate-binding protein